MALEAISEHLISKKFPGGVCPQTPLVLHAYACMHACTPYTHVTPLFGYGPEHSYNYKKERKKKCVTCSPTPRIC